MAQIKITKCDNQVVIYATISKDGVNASYQVCDIQSGYNYGVDISINLYNAPYNGPLKLDGLNGPISGSYNVNIPHSYVNLAVVGIDWGGKADFSVSINGEPPYTYDKNYDKAIVVALGDSLYGSSSALKEVSIPEAASASE